MKLLIAMGVGAVLVGTSASAQLYEPYRPYGSGATERQVGQTTYTRDRETGNRYGTTQNYDGSVTVRGNNYETGSHWKTDIKPDGDQTGTDADGNRWRYDSQTNVYRNSGTGVTCRGTGSRRSCY